MAEEKTFELPDEIIQEIQSFLSCEDAARSCFLNKSWLSSWRTSPVLDFDLPSLLRRNEKALQKAVTDTLARYREENLRVRKLRLCLHDLSITPLLNSWLETATECGLETLSLSFNHCVLKYSTVVAHLGNSWLETAADECALKTDTLAAKTLKELSILGCRFHDDQNPMLQYHFLDFLRLSEVVIKECTLQNLLKNCPSIILEKLTLSGPPITSSVLPRRPIWRKRPTDINLEKLKYKMDLKYNPFIDTRDWFEKLREVLLELLPSETELVIQVPKGNLILIPSVDFQSLYPIRDGKHVYISMDSSFVSELAKVLEPVISMYCDPRYVSTFWESPCKDFLNEKPELLLFEKLEMMGRRKAPDSFKMKCWLKEVQLARERGHGRVKLQPLLRDGWKYGPAITTKQKSSIRITFGLKW